MNSHVVYTPIRSIPGGAQSAVLVEYSIEYPSPPHGRRYGYGHLAGSARRISKMATACSGVLLLVLVLGCYYGRSDLADFSRAIRAMTNDTLGVGKMQVYTSVE